MAYRHSGDPHLAQPGVDGRHGSIKLAVNSQRPALPCPAECPCGEVRLERYQVLARETLVSHSAVHRPVKCLAGLGSGHLMRDLSPVLPPTACTHPVVVGLILTRASNFYLVTGSGTC